MSAGPIIAPGELDQRVQLQQRVESENGLGEAVGDWVNVGDPLWARVRPWRARDLFAAGRAQIEADIEVRIRYRVMPTVEYRIVWRGQPLEVVGVPINVEAANAALDILCLQGARDGR